MSRTKKIADMAIFVAIGIIVNIVSFPTAGTYFGRFSLVYVFAYIAGICFGGGIGACIAVLSDLIPALLLPQGPWQPFITISVGAIALIMGLCNRYIPLRFVWRLGIGMFVAYLCSTCILSPLGELALFDIYPYTLAKLLGAQIGIESKFLMLSLSKAISQPIWIVMNGMIGVVVCTRLQKVLDNRYGNVINKTFAREKSVLVVAVQE